MASVRFIGPPRTGGVGGNVRAVDLILAVLLLTVPATGVQAASSQHNPLDRTNGSFEAGLFGAGQALWPKGVPAPDHERFDLPISPCHRTLSLGLLYEPKNASAGARVDGNVVHASFPYRFRAGLLDPNGTVMHRIIVDEPDLSIPFGTVERAGDYTLELELLEGAMVDFQVRVRGFQPWADDEPTCELWLNEVETNPPGPDAGREWVELYNEGDVPVDVSGWRVRGTQPADGSATYLIPNGTSVAAGGYEQVRLDGDTYLADENETVELLAPSGGPLDASVPLDDTADGAGTWQKAADGLGDWIFAEGTPGGPNAG